jgi:hypothetical protein
MAIDTCLKANLVLTYFPTQLANEMREVTSTDNLVFF